MAQVKTNAMRLLDRGKVDYHMYSYEPQDGKIDGISVAEKINKNPKAVYKTLVAQAISKNIYVFVIPVEAELDLKKAAKAANEKKIDLIAVKDIQKHTGYIRGGCSPIGMKKLYSTFIDETASSLDMMIVSGGKIGVQIELNPNDLLQLVRGTYASIIKSEL